MNRLTDDNTAEKLREVSDKLKSGGFEVDVSNERYIKLADYERIAETPEELRKHIGRLCSDFQKMQAELDRYEAIAQDPEEVEE